MQDPTIRCRTPHHRPFRRHFTSHASPLTTHDPPLTTHRSPLTAHRSPLTAPGLHLASHRSHTELVRRERDPRDGPSTSTGATFHVKHGPTDCASPRGQYSSSLPHCSSWSPRSPARSTQSQSTSGDPSCVDTLQGRPGRCGRRCAFSAQSAAARG
ncbi:hypothetical protein CQ047_18395 [Microbacterium sp. MYb72]|nr:hypothetical protein CQ047_18395 [Microbacterium sp. MYb72]